MQHTLDMEKVCQGVRVLSRLFTTGREDLHARYFDSQDLLDAYVAYFLPVNAAKVESVLEELPPIPRDKPPGESPMRFLDIGAGPGTAVRAILQGLSRQPFSWNRPLQGVLMDASKSALNHAAQEWTRFLDTTQFPNSTIQVLPTNLEKKNFWYKLKGERPFHWIILANSINELFRNVQDGLMKKVKLLRALWALLSDDGAMIIIEPALREQTRDLHRIRDILVAQEGATVYSPCLHEQSCPALVHPKDWCHEDRPWMRTPLIEQIDQRLGFGKESLKFSYVVLRKDTQHIITRHPHHFRVVSELLIHKGERRVWVCNETGRFQVGRLDRDQSPSNTVFGCLHRGTLITINSLKERKRTTESTFAGRIQANARVEVIRNIGDNQSPSGSALPC